MTIPQLDNGLLNVEIWNRMKEIKDAQRFVTGDIRDGTITDGGLIKYDSGRLQQVDSVTPGWAYYDGETARVIGPSPTDVGRIVLRYRRR